MKRSIWMTGILFVAVSLWVLFRDPGMGGEPVRRPGYRRRPSGPWWRLGEWNPSLKK